MRGLPTLTSVESSHLQGIGAQGGDLYIRFRSGHVFKYKGAGHMADAGIKAESAGKWFHANVKGKFPHVQINV